ncbi:hypothetical protein F5Y03DRAFT_388322 [Xylaria venustula]|nr:hypothetical protein F5Y03DRAFT_388322 [Xylaria venustula]
MPYYTYDQISSCGHEFLVLDYVFTALCLIFLGLRFWSAAYSGRKLSLDDLFVILGFLGVVALVAASFWGSFNGLGKAITELQPPQVVILVKDLLISEFGYLLGTAGIKMSMLCLYHRIYTTPTFRRVNYVAMFLVAGYFSKLSKHIWPRSKNGLLTLNAVVSFIPLFLTNCVPISQYWDPKPTGWCRDTVKGDNATLAANLVLDLIVLALPLPVLWNLRMSIRDKMTVTALFGFGFVTIALVIWRLVVTERTRGSADWTKTLCNVGIIAALELWLGVIAVCIPTLGPLFNAYLKPVFTKLGLTNGATKPTPSNHYLKTFGSSGTNKRSRKYSELNDSADHIVSRDDSIKLTPTVEGKVVSECTFNDAHAVENGRGGIRIQRDIEAQYHPKKAGYLE